MDVKLPKTFQRFLKKLLKKCVNRLAAALLLLARLLFRLHSVAGEVLEKGKVIFTKNIHFINTFNNSIREQM